MNRWKAAQQAERNHPTHTDVVSDQEYAKARFESIWGESISVLSDKNVLAVGGGTGIIHALNNSNLQISVDPLYETKQISPTQTNAELICGSGEYLPFQKSSFDIIISHNVLDHTQNPKKVMEEINRVIRTDGQLFFSVNIFSLPKVIRNSIRLIDTPHPHHFSTGEVRQILESSGFRIKETNKGNHSFSDESIATLLSRGEIKKVGGKLAQIGFFSAICYLDN